MLGQTQRAFLTGQTGAIGTTSQLSNGGATTGQTAEPKSYAEVKTIADQQLYGLLSLQDNLTFEKATLPKFYDEYTDGLRDKAPLIPLLRYVDSTYKVVTVWVRLPLELLEMALLVGMGALGGVIAVTRCSSIRRPRTDRTRLALPAGGRRRDCARIRTTRNSFCEWVCTGRFGIGIGLLRSRGSCSD